MGYATWADGREHGRGDFIATAVAPGTDALIAATVVLAVIAVVTTMAVAVRHRRQWIVDRRCTVSGPLGVFATVRHSGEDLRC
jgi:hypothetical protein